MTALELLELKNKLLTYFFMLIDDNYPQVALFYLIISIILWYIISCFRFEQNQLAIYWKYGIR